MANILVWRAWNMVWEVFVVILRVQLPPLPIIIRCKLNEKKIDWNSILQALKLGCLSFSNVLVQTFCEMNLILWKGCNEFKHRLNLRIVCIRLDDKRWRAQVVITGIRYRQRQLIFNFLMKVSWLKIRFLFLLIYPTIATFSYKLCLKVFVLCWNCLITALGL